MEQQPASSSPPPSSAASPEQRAAALNVHSELVARHLAKSKEHGAHVLRTGQALVFIDDNQLYKEARDADGEADKDIYAWVYRVHGLGRDQANKYLEIGRKLTPALVADLAAGVEALYLLAQADPRVRGTLREILLNRIGGVRFELVLPGTLDKAEQGGLRASWVMAEGAITIMSVVEGNQRQMG